jgi:hypothetical protein
MLKHWVFAVGCLLAFGLAGVSDARAQSVNADAKAAAKEFVVVMRMGDQMRAVMPSIMQALKPAIVQGRAEVERDYDGIQKLVMGGFLARLDDFMEALSIVYARHFSAAELRELSGFMRGPTGQKFVEKTPVVLNEGIVVGQKFGEQVAAEMRDKMIEELRKRGHNI